ncbi:uncharacterized protein LOC129787489 isoform X2 [Lutzomyia longipalpis]|uniref:Dystroglycan 1 n=1 Tax=Lutzomyia longipalpis TaxID=7200 RepID=A0A7G3AB58_LUTLO|nr:uncharacterized protein LOC129787489 isoform X2 [Lutzomyia longipalpis]
MISTRRNGTSYSFHLHWSIVIVIGSLIVAAAQQDFQFENGNNEEDLQYVFTEPVEQIAETVKPTKNTHYEKELSQCPHSESKIVLSLVLKSQSWSNIVDNKKTKAVNKLSRFFMVPKKFFHFDDISRRDIYEMVKYSSNRGPNPPNMGSSKKVGRIEFVVGCDNELFPTGKLIANQIAEQMKDGTIADISGLEFEWWSVWRRRASNRVPRTKRETEGSGEDEYDDYYDEEDEEEEEITEVPTVSTHAHRHHHVDNNEGEIEEEEEKLTDSILPDATHRESTTYKSPETTPTSNLAEKATRSPFAVIPEEPRASATTTEMPDDYDEEDDDEEIISRTSIYDAVPTVSPTTESSPTTTTSAPTTTTTTERIVTTTEYIEPEPVNSPPMIKNRLPKQALTAGKPFSLHVPLETFYDNEDVYNLQLVLYDKNDHPLKANSWIQFNKETREIYGLPLEDAVSRWQYRLHASDSIGQSVTETLDISVQQHKSHRSANHEISIGIRLNEKFSNSVDWQMKVVRAIVSTMGDASMNNVVVREIRHSQQDPNSATFVYTNETLPKDRCVEEELEGLVKRLHTKDFSDVLMPEISVKSVTGQPIGPCQKHSVPKPKPTPTISKNFAPVPRNQVDRVNATVGQLLIFQVPQDTFYDPEDGTNLRLSLLSLEGSKLDAKHWLQFDSKNQEFYGIPKPADVGQREYLLVAEDREGLTATDALVVVVNHAPKRDYSALFEMTLGISNENFNNSATQRRFIERVAQAFGDVSTANIQVRSIRALHHSGHTLVSFYNTTIYRQHHICPHDEIEVLRNVLMYPDASVRDRVRETIGTEFNLLSVNLIPAGTCQGTDTMIHDPFVPIKTEDKPAPTFKDDYLLTFVLPAVIILAMLLLASIIACVLHRRRLTGKMELGDEEERRSFRSKGIPVIFQDELDEKPEIGNKSPVILKDEKPPLLPPSYNSTNPDGDNEDVDEYVPPPAVIIGGRESRGKSPVTPSYRKPPPYVSP